VSFIFFKSTSFFILLFIIFYKVWTFYFLNLNYSLSKFCTKQTTITIAASKSISKFNVFYFWNFFLNIIIFLVTFFFFFKSTECFLYFNSLFIVRFNHAFICLYLTLILVFLYFSSKFINLFYFFKNNLDFVVSLIFLFSVCPFIFFSNNLLSFFFFIELCSLLTFYMLIASRDLFFNNKKNFNKNLKNTENKKFFNVIFYNFWSAFFSSMFLVYSILNLFFIFGTTEWAFLNFLTMLYFQSYNFSTSIPLIFIFFLFFFSSVFKLGLPPLFFFKVEIYKGLPLIMLFLYSTIFFFFYLAAFFFLFFKFFFSFFVYFSCFFFIFFFSSIFFFFYYLFKASNLNVFFSLSSVINTIFLFFLFFSFNF